MLQERKHDAQGLMEPQAEQSGEAQEFTPQTRFSAAGPIPPVQTDFVHPQPTASDLAYGPPRGTGTLGKGGQRIGDGGNTVEETRVDPTLEVDTPHLRFPATPIGMATTAQVNVRNADHTAHTLDPTRPVAADPFHDFSVRENSSVVLPPGQSRPVTIEFKPTRHLTADQAFHLSSDKGVGPQGGFSVSGDGVEAGGANDAEREALEKGRIADQDFQRDQLDAQRTNDPNKGKRVAAQAAVTEWTKRAQDYNQSLADWTQQNFERFLGKTGGDVHVSEPGRIAKFIKSKALKGVAAMAAPEKAAEEEIAKTALGKYGLKAVDKAVEKYSEWLWDQLTGEKKAPSAEEAALQATEHMADKSIAKARDISHARDAANLVVSDSESAARMKIAEGGNAADIDGVRSWAQSELASVPKNLDPKDASLSEELLATWLRERAATPKKANDETNSKAWDKARGELAKSGKVPTLETHDLFIHQCRNEWTRIGVDSGQLESALAELDATRRAVEEESARGGTTDQAAMASEIQRRVATSEKQFMATFDRAADPAAMAAAFAPHNYQFDPDGPDKDHFAGRFTLTCHLSLKTSGAGVYVDTFWYHETKTGHYERKP